MNKILKNALLIVLITVHNTSLAQGVKIKPLSVGDVVPDVNLKGFIGNLSKQAKVSHYYGGHKLLLIDLSATWCVPCVEAWPKLDSLKKIFKGDLEVLAVTQEKRKTVENFLKAHPELKKLDLEFLTDNITNNPVLAYSFPHKMVPQVIWINSKGKIIGSTDGSYVSQQNIQRAINDQSIDLKIKKDRLDFNPDTYELPDSLIAFKSFITRNQPGINGMVRYQPSQNIDKLDKFYKEILYTNCDVKTLYREAAFHHSISDYNAERITWEVPDSIRMKYEYAFYKQKTQDNNSAAWYDKNAYCIEIKVDRPFPAELLYKQLINDLNVQFDLNAHFEKRMLPCWVLKSSNPAKIQTTATDTKVVYKSGLANDLKNQSMAQFLYFLNRDIDSGWIVDGTGIKGNIDISLTGFHGTLTSPAVMNEVLSKYDLTLVKEVRMVDVLVISQKRGI